MYHRTRVRLIDGFWFGGIDVTAQPVALPHPLTTGVQAIEAALSDMSIDSWDGLDETEVKILVEKLMRIGARVAAHQSAGTRVLDESGLARRSGASSTGALLAGSFGGDRAAGERLVRTGQLLAQAGKVEQALADGTVSERQAKAIAGAVSSLPDGVSDVQKQQCQDVLIADAQELTAKDLERRALRVTDIFKPADQADANENASLQERERRAWAKSSFEMWDNRDGTHSGRFTLPEAQADMLRTAVNAISAPRRDHLHDHQIVDQPAGADRLGRGFAELASHLPTEGLPQGGATGATLVVRFDYQTLIEGIKPATLSTGTRISAGQARQLACRMGLIPEVFGGTSVPLDMGRTKRLFTPHQKLAIAARDGGCTAPWCDRPPEWTEVHHFRQPWATGGTTNLDDGMLVCSHDHHVLHDQGWNIRLAADDVIEWQAPGTTEWQRNRRWRT